MSEVRSSLIPNDPNCKRILHKGVKGEDVAWSQDKLGELNGFYKFCPSTKPLQMTRYFGDETAKFLKFYQYYEDLLLDCNFDKENCDRLNHRYIDYLDFQSRTGFAKFKSINE